MNASKLEAIDREQSKKIADSMPENLYEFLEEKAIKNYNDHLILIKAADSYYGMINISGTLVKINTENFTDKELFVIHKYTCGIKVGKDNKIRFISGKREPRYSPFKLWLYGLVVPVNVLTECSYWEYDFYNNRLKKIKKSDYE